MPEGMYPPRGERGGLSAVRPVCHRTGGRMSDYPPPPPGGMPPAPPPGAPPPPPGMPPPPPSGGGPQLYQPPPPSYGAPPPVGAQPMGQYGMAPKTNTLAIISLVASLVWVCGLGSIAAVITGFMARKQISQSGGTQTGGGMAVAGIVIGGLGVLGLVLWILIVVIASATSDSNALAHLAAY